MGDMNDFSQLSESWLYWGRLAGLSNVQSLSISQVDDLWFRSDDHSVHIRREDESWVIDTVDERGQLHSDIAKFSTFSLAEKFLVWDWASAARNAIRLPRFGPEFYALGMDANVRATPLKEGIYELETPEGRAVLMEPSATIFSHLISKSLSEIEELVSQGL